MELSVEQRQIATQRPNGHYLLKGVAGSGKTLVGLYRALFLSKNYCFDKDDMVLVAAYNRTLVQYMEHLYTRLQDHNQKDCYSLFTCRNRSVCIQTIDSLMVPYFKDYVKAQRRSYTIGVPRNVSHDIITVGITKIKADYPDVSFLKEKYWVFLLQEIQWIKSSLLTKESDYLNADRLGMGKVNEQAYFQRLPKNSSARKAVFELMQHYTDEIRQRNFCTFADMRIMALWQVRRECKQRYSHLIIDESQDLTHSQLLFLKEIYNCRKPHASILFIMDSAQNIYPQSWLGSGRNIAGIGFNMAGRGYNLHQNRRSTDRIYQAACGLIEECPQIVTKTTSSFPISNRIQGCLPVCRSFSNLNEQADFIAAEIKKTKNIQSLGNVAVLARFKDQLEQLRRRLLEKRIPCGIFMDAAHLFQTEQVNLVTLHSIKGLEFSTVFICGIDEGQLPYLPEHTVEEKDINEIKERKLLYVGMTRAMQKLYLLSGPRPSSFFIQVAQACRRADFKRRIRPFYALEKQKYHFLHKLGRLSREEECVRQWLIAELVDSYGFPLDCITVDKYIPDAHSRGYMDVTVAINRSGRVADFIYFKILQKEERFKDAVDQISVFMDYTPSCCYGVATNGRTLIIVDRTHKEVEDIPNFKPAWRLSSAVRYLYRNLKTKQQHVICFDPDDSTFLELEQGDNSEILDLYQLEEVNVYGCIAAGNPIQINEESEKVFYLPKMWCRGGKYFILNTTGDSMKGAAISDGDLVLVRSQSFAANMDIAVVALDNQGAIKRLRRKGKRVILQAENPHYESIEVSEDKVIILGIVVGILRPLPQAWNRGQLVAC